MIPHFPHYAGQHVDQPSSFHHRARGYKKVAQRLGKPESTVHGWTAAEDGKMPSRLYQALCDLADEAGVARPPLDLFRFLPSAPKARPVT